MSLPTLLKVAGGVGVVGLGASIWMEQKQQSSYRQQGFYQKSVRLLQDYHPAAQFLGKPIFSGRVTIGDRNLLNVDDFSAKLVIPVVGPLDKGSLYVQASREDKMAEWNIDQLDLEIKSSKQKWTFYQRKTDAAQLPCSSDVAYLDSDLQDEKLQS
ncbi:cytochrome c oxidase assembly protein 1-like protein [Plakobranchus ocellatus]|uniref:Cytochrome c oxidase assembly protein 1-like protein n=1 Tax=Plakobranchus ocellatus TaxID=259542 RepID=A0AAV4AGV2_9GAST|nr:cytochrome c oxidase assembly protein 1-like protein [Plakobranchus ocellatus]